MADRIARGTLPRTEKGIDSLAKGILKHAGPHIEGIGGGVGDWTDISIISWMSFKAAQEAWVFAYDACAVEHVKSVTAAKNRAKDVLCKAITELVKRGLLLSPRTEEDIIAMGFTMADEFPTVITEVTDKVDMSISNDPVPNSNRQIIKYKILGAASRSKAPYHLAAFQVYIQGPGDPDPKIDDDSVWSKDVTNMTSPYCYQHLSDDAGKFAWFRARWQAKNGLKGPWVMSRARI